MNDVDVIKNFIRSINFQKKTPECVEDQTIEESTEETATTTDTTCTFEKLDSIKSCESVLKIFGFEPGNFDKNNEKCLRFWATINERTDLKPVNCLIMDAQNNKKNCDCQTEEKESESSIWARALYELRKRKLDKLAMLTSLPSCKFCEAIPKYPCAGYSKEDLEDNEDITVLNDWNPMLKTRGMVNVSTGIDRTQLFKDESLDVQDPASLLGIQAKSEPTVSAEDEDVIQVAGTEDITIEVIEDKQEDKTVDDKDEDQVAKPKESTASVIEDKLQDKNVEDADEDQITKNEDITAAVIEDKEEDKNIEDVDAEAISVEAIEVEQQQNEPATDEEKQEILSLLREIFNNVFANQTISEKPVMKEYKDNFNEVQNIVSLLGLQPGQYQADAATKVPLKQNQRRSSIVKVPSQSYDNKKQLTFQDDISYVEEEITSTTLCECPCTMELKEQSGSRCMCEGDICKKGTMNVVEMKKLIAKQLARRNNSYSKRMCIDRIFEKLKDGDLTSEETAAYLQQIMDSCACLSSTCECIMHHIDLPETKDTVDNVFIKEMLMEKFNNALKAAQIRENSRKTEKKKKFSSIGSQCENDVENQSIYSEM